MTIKVNTTNFDFGGVLGAGVELEIVMIELRYSIGFLDVERSIEFSGQTYHLASNNF